MKLHRLSILLAALFCAAALLPAQVPQIINYQGRVAVNGINFSGTGSFKFALVDGTGATTYWSNDGTSTGGSEPTAAVSLGVSSGLYSVLLGDTSLAHMTAVPPSVFGNSDVRLRVWFNDGTNGSQLLSPDQRFAAVGYAMTVAASTVGNAQLGLGTISGNVTCNNTDPTHTFVYLRGTNSLCYVGSLGANGYPYQLTLVPPGTYTLVAHTSSGYEAATQVTVAAGQTVSAVNVSAVNLLADTNNCGTCGNVCSSANGTAGCSTGTCTIACSTGYGNCDNNVANGCETNLTSNVNNCGACNNVCPTTANSTPVCTGSACGIVCNTGYGDCDNNAANGCEVNLTNSVNNCGKCATVCSSSNGTPSCVNSSCQIKCNAGFADCNNSRADGCEVNLNTDVNNCGACGNVCGAAGANATRVCISSNCGILCNSGYTNCGGDCVNTQTDTNNCGGCGRGCPTGKTCVAGACG